MRTLLIGILAGYGIAIPVGAISLLIVQVGMKCGFRCGASAGAGAATADLLYSVLAVVAGAGLAQALEPVGTPVRWASGAVLAAMAVAGLLRARREPLTTETTIPSRGEYAATYAKFLGLTVINPMTVVYFTAFVLGLGVASDFNLTEGALFVTGVFGASLSWQTLLAAMGSFAGQRMPARFRTWAVIVGNLLVLAMAVLIVAR
jgi:threonine/homoserine/homoserine lactone efflux protein